MSKLTGHVLVGGGTGFIGTHLCEYLTSKGYGVTIISRMPGPKRITWHNLTNNGIPKDVTSVVNLAGQNILDVSQRWTEGFKQNVWNSRINSNQSLANAIVNAETKPKVFVSISGVGIYQPSDKIEYTEESESSEFDFLSKLAINMEKSSQLPKDIGCRHVTIRSGVVLGRKGGMIKQLYVPFYLGLGGPVGSGQQYLPWIHVTDMVRLITFAIENDNVSGVLNGVAPEQITNKQFTEAFANAMWRPAYIPLPESVLNLVFSEERAKIMTQGQRVVPHRVQQYGFKYTYPDIGAACNELVR